MKTYRLICPCLFGLESILAFEIKKIGGENVVVEDGRVLFDGDLHVAANANLWLRTAERVGIVLGMFEAKTFTELFDQTAALPWEEFIGIDDRFPVKGWSLKSQLHSVPDCQKIIKRAVVRRFESEYHQSQFAETGILYQIQFSIHKDEVTLMLDMSGPGLHKRGYRGQSTLAPIKETLAAGIADLARVREDSVVYDPMCGSGTLVIEAALRALNIAPGIRRKFAAQSWTCYQNSIFADVRKAALEQVRRDAKFVAYASDIDPDAATLTRKNAALAGVGGRVKIARADIRDFSAKTPGIILVNPPYGERIADQQEAETLCRVMGEVFGENSGTSQYIISPHEQFEELFGKKASRRRKLYNGMIKCQLYMYF